MPCNMTRYGPDWKPFAHSVKFLRAQGRCECQGQCGMHHGRRCTERHNTKAMFARGTIRLTTAHLCDCDPPCIDWNHVIAACQRCHLRIDRWKHAKSRQEARQRIVTR